LSLDDLFNFLKKRGISDTYKILTKFKNYKTNLHAFYKELNKFSYYNSFLRVKDKLIRKGLIIIETQNREKIIRLTEKGIDIYLKLIEINDML
jgi:predicted transcriptional regulator